MESTFKSLDSDLLRLECTDAQQNVIDDLWRLIKMMYNGATRQEALAARHPDKIEDSLASRLYRKVLQCMNPNSSQCSECTLDELEEAHNALAGYGADQLELSSAQIQVIGQLRKAIQGSKGGDPVQVAIKKAWKERDDAARQRLCEANHVEDMP